MHIRQAAHEAGGKVGQAAQQNAPHAAQCLNIGICSMRHALAAKELGHDGELMRRQARQRDAGERERVDPDIGNIGSTWNLLDEPAVECRVVRNHGTPANELRQGRHSVNCRGRMRYIGIRDARQLGDFLGYQPARLHKGVEAIHNLAAAQTGGRDFDQLAIAVRQSRGLRIEHDDVVLYQAERTSFSALGECRIALHNRRRRAGQYRGSHLERRSRRGDAHRAARSRASSTSSAHRSLKAMPA